MATAGITFDNLELAAMKWAFETSNAKGRIETRFRAAGDNEEANKYRDLRWKITCAFDWAMTGHTSALLELYRQSHDYRVSEFNKAS